MKDASKCPGCGVANPSDAHLRQEYLDLTKASFDRIFGRNAEVARNEVAKVLVSRGVKSIPNIFGDIAILVYAEPGTGPSDEL